MQGLQFEKMIRDKWTTSPDLYSPLRLATVDFERRLQTSAGDEVEVDIVFEVTWQKKQVRFFGEAKPNATPRSVRFAMEKSQQIAQLGIPADQPALVLPYLSPGIVEELDGSGVSALDLCGNYLIQTPDLLAIRLDQPNEYPTSRDIKKIYSYNSSIVGRFLLREDRRFEQVNEIYEGIQERGGGISLSTVSKVLKGLADDLMIEKTKECIRVLQPRELLARLKAGYRSPRDQMTFKLKLPDNLGGQQEILTEVLGKEGWIWSGTTSAQAYATTTPPTTTTVYTPELLTSTNPLRKYENERFYNCIIKQTNDAFAYFDRNGFWSSAVETCLALSQLDKREREIARTIEESILVEFPDHV